MFHNFAETLRKILIYLTFVYVRSEYTIGKKKKIIIYDSNIFSQVTTIAQINLRGIKIVFIQQQKYSISTEKNTPQFTHRSKIGNNANFKEKRISKLATVRHKNIARNLNRGVRCCGSVVTTMNFKF